MLLLRAAETVAMAAIGTTIATILALALCIFAARNLMPPLVTWPARLIVVMARSFHPVIVAIVFVKAVGFGALAGTLASCRRRDPTPPDWRSRRPGRTPA